MEIRPVAELDSDDIQDVVERSIRASYSLSPNMSDALIDEWFDTDQLIRRVSRSDMIARVAEQDASIVGYGEGRIQDSIGELYWLHVSPAARGEGVGTELFDQLRENFRDAGVDTVRARVLAENSEGEEFVERFGFSKIDHATLDLGNEELIERVYSPTAEETNVAVPETTTIDGDTVLIDREDPISGADAEFLPVYLNGDHEEEQYGFYCANCGCLSGVMDELERIRCETCGNSHRPDEWDEAYL